VKHLLALVIVVVAGCSAAKDSFTISNVNGCIQKQCSSSGDNTDRASCESACRQTYGR
jgi:hypothetical protein